MEGGERERGERETTPPKKKEVVEIVIFQTPPSEAIGAACCRTSKVLSRSCRCLHDEFFTTKTKQYNDVCGHKTYLLMLIVFPVFMEEGKKGRPSPIKNGFSFE
jgi:hypothetical protein